MIQLRVLSGKQAGLSWVARRFPVRVGRSPDADLQVEDDGIWDRHLQVVLLPGEGFRLRSQPEALAIVNGQSVQDVPLRNGDVIEIGAVKIQFWLGETRQAGFRWREWCLWGLLVLISLGQIALVYWLGV